MRTGVTWTILRHSGYRSSLKDILMIRKRGPDERFPLPFRKETGTLIGPGAFLFNWRINF